MASYEKKVFISYAWGGEREEYVNEIDIALQRHGLEIIRDKRELEYKGSIKAFMERIGQGDCIIVVISDKYLRSPNCMFELVEIADNKNFEGRVFPIVLEDANIFDPIVIIDYLEHWQNQLDKLDAALSRIKRGNTVGLNEQYDLYLRIRSRFDQLTTILRNMNVLTPSMHRTSGFGVLYESIFKRLKESTHGEQEIRPKVPTTKPMVTNAPVWPRDKSPYPGLPSFEVEDAPIFFGREADTKALIKRLENPGCHFLMVVGASGSGKSSLVKAGLLAHLKDEKAESLPGSQGWLVRTIKPDEYGDGNPFTALVAELRVPLKLNLKEILPGFGGNPMNIVPAMEKYLENSPETMRILLFIDQFEELFTRITNTDTREKFVEFIQEVWQVKFGRILIVATIRADFYQYCVASRSLDRMIKDSTFPLSAPGVWDMHEMIAGPAQVAGLQLEQGLVGQILRDTGSDPGALALMAFALKLLYNESGDRRLMTFETYNKFGGVQGAIGTHAMETFKDLPQDAQVALPRVFRELLTVDENGTTTRKRTKKEQVAQDEASKILMERLIDNRLLVTSSNDELIEVAHEALFRSWPDLAKWIDEIKDDLVLLRQVRAAAAEWEKGNFKKFYLWPDERLRPVYAMQKRLEPRWTKIEQEFIRPEAEWLLIEIEDPATSHIRRSEIGERLSRIGDPRPGVGLVQRILSLKPREIPENGQRTSSELREGELRLWGEKPEHEGLPDIVWLPVEGGSIQIEKHDFNVQSFYIAKYLITYKQFQSFVIAEDGFNDPRWWQDLSDGKGYEWGPGKQNFKFDNLPRETVSWYDAIAFCRWMNNRLGWPDIPANLSPEDLEAYTGIRLPAEWEWQLAATGRHHKYDYPWGEWVDDKANANTAESGLRRTTVVGMYPFGTEQNIALDLSGNVFEFCLNEYNSLMDMGLSSSNQRAVRGGSWNNGQGYACASFRNLYGPYSRDDDLGFRIFVRPASMENTQSG
jgi:hypothetical protein